MKEINIIKATKKHSKLIWIWRNDPITRNNFVNSKNISWEDHKAWYEEALNSNDKKIYIGEQEKRLIGVVRFDKCKNKHDLSFISINIAPSERGRGIATILLPKSIKQFFLDSEIKKLQAEVKTVNKPSNKLFKNCGFLLIDSTLEMNIYEFSKKVDVINKSL